MRSSTCLLAFAFALIACSSQQDDTPPPTEPVQSAPNCSRLTTPCEVGGPCEGAPDCKSNACRDGKCQAVNPPNGVQDNGETDVDCGGPSSAACADGKKCAVAADCTSDVCTGGTCQAPSPTDGVKNGDETGVDCGGATAPKCPEGQGCGSDADCNNLKCDPTTKKCLGPTHEDGFKNGDETGVDCGGPTATKKCAPGDGCAMDSDCDNVRCDTANKKCLPPSATDMLKNGTETDIDCGGGAPTNAPKCAATKGCLVHADCLSDGCNAYEHKCALAPSCAAKEGGITCGKGELDAMGNPIASHESCCAYADTGLTKGGKKVYVDKYEITAGRVREFINRTGGNVKKWADDHDAALSQEVRDFKQYLPINDDDPIVSFKQCAEDGTGCTTQQVRFGVHGQLGNEVFMADRPCAKCGQGCWIGLKADFAYGHPTYWWSDVDQSNQFGAQPRKFTKEQLDTKPLNCTTQLFFAAFCAWDGGRLPTQAELAGNNASSAWGTSTYPWGTQAYDTPLAGAPNKTQYPWTVAPRDPLAYQADAFLEPYVLGNGTINAQNAVDYNVTNWNPFNQSPTIAYIRYMWPNVAPASWDQTDQAYAIAAPGRFYKDFHAAPAGGAGNGWYDVGANMIEVTGEYTPCSNPDNSECAAPYSTCNTTLHYCVDDANHNSLPAVPWVGGSFEGHQPGVRNGYHRSILTKYGKQGARCAREL